MVDYICVVDIEIEHNGIIKSGDKVKLEKIITSTAWNKVSRAVIRVENAQFTTEIAIDVFMCGFIKQ